MTKHKKVAVWSLWIVLWPSCLYTLYQTLDPSIQNNEVEIAAFIILASIVALFPLQVGDNPVFFTHGIAFAVFLYYGLFIEILVSQIALLFLMAKLRVRKADFYRVPINFLMFLMISVFSALLYYFLGGTHGDDAVSSFDDALPVTAYAVSQILLNQFSIKLIARFLYNKQVKWVDRGLLWDVLTACLVLPIGLVLYIVYAEFGVSAVFFVGIPFILIAGMLMLYHNSSQVNTYLKKTSIIGHELTGKLGVKEVLDLFVKRISQLLPLDYLYVFDVTSEKQLTLIHFFDRSGQMKLPNHTLFKGESVSGNTLSQRSSFYFKSKKEWHHLNHACIPEKAESVMSIPVERNNEIVGIITIYANKKRAFMQFQFMILEILGNYLGVAIDNARYYERTKAESERCALTGLYNYRYFENHLHRVFQQWKDEHRKQPISLILMDLDHFKMINDTYGHESGNEVLCILADRLQQVIHNQGLIARYGGEEFVILLPECSTDKAEFLAEDVRRAITDKPFISYEHLLSGKKPKDIKVTASIGVATYPDHCEEPLELIRHADRAMYVGAKQQGRDKVASYEALLETVE
ncbi:sensor domain-containing diguanylate cyclase [Halobacillus mangrovi]|uniref:sensor domain-containing diguanylate cyclase n=1 Tax=Halobacillus mangrovi TaxID=402384 RepID=UPI003D99CB10